MSEYLQRVISRLYRPPSNGRQAFALSRADAERLPPIPGVAVISITAPDKGPAKLPGVEHMLRLSFADVDHLASNLSRRQREKLRDAFTHEHTQKIVEFVISLPDDVHSMVVHCEGGYSRSCAVALALHEVLGYAVDIDRLAGANPSVQKMLVEGLRLR